MIISKNFIFIAVPKSGSQTVRYSLKKNIPYEYEEQCNLIEPKKIEGDSYLKSIQTGHITLTQLTLSSYANKLNDYFVFGFVRNPYERFISSYFFGYERKADTKEMKDLLLKSPNIWFKPQTNFLKHQDQLCHFYKIEDCENAFADLSSKLGYRVELVMSNTNNYPVRDYYAEDEELKRMVEDRYVEDFHNFGYQIRN